MTAGTVHTVELRCKRNCGYEAAVGNAIPSARARLTPEECPRCGAEVVTL